MLVRACSPRLLATATATPRLDATNVAAAAGDVPNCGYKRAMHY
jgi:hypothetical protein